MESNNLKKLLLLIVAVVAVIILLIKLNAGETIEPTTSLEANMTDETRQLNEEIDVERGRDIAFEHVMPGVYSEIYYTVGNLEPNTTFTASLYRDDELGHITEGDDLTVTVDGFGVARFVWKIDQFGDYSVSDDEWGIEVSTVVVTVK